LYSFALLRVITEYTGGVWECLSFNNAYAAVISSFVRFRTAARISLGEGIFMFVLLFYGKSILALVDTGKSHQHLQILGIRLVECRFQLVEVGECLLPLQHETILQIECVFLNVGEIAGRQVVCLIAPIHRGVNLHLGCGIHGFSVAEHHFG